MLQISFDDLIYMHDQIIEVSGGFKGIKDEGVIHSAIARPYQTAFGDETYPDIFDKAAAILESIANNHGFNDGNKRTAMGAAILFLYAHSIKIEITNIEYEDFMLFVVTKKPEIEVIGNWLKNHIA